jgi:group I intron endonuclease
MTFLDHIMKLPAVGGIYEIKNIRTGDRYIGRAVNLRQRVFGHYRALEKRTHPNYLMQKEYRMHGRDSFKVRVLELCAHADERSAREQFYVDARSPEYNLATTTGGSDAIKRDEEKSNRRYANAQRREDEKQRRARQEAAVKFARRVASTLMHRRLQAVDLDESQRSRLRKRVAWHEQRNAPAKRRSAKKNV